MTLYFDVERRTWAVDEREPAPERSWTPAAAGFIVLLGSIAAAVGLQFLGA